jgi:hypothetical protein
MSKILFFSGRPSLGCAWNYFDKARRRLGWFSINGKPAVAPHLGSLLAVEAQWPV